MSDKMKRTQVYLPEEVYEKLKERADAEGITMATQIREALVRYIATQESETGELLEVDDPIWSLIGMGESGIEDGSTQHDQYVYRRDWGLPETK